MPFLSASFNESNGNRARSPALSVISATPATRGSNVVSTSNSLASSPTTNGPENNLTNPSQSVRSRRAWLQDIYLNQVERYELIAQGYNLKRLDIISGLDLQDAANHLPIAFLYEEGFRGWIKKSQTFPKMEANRRRTL